MLSCIFRWIEIGLLDFHIFPIHVELVSDDHGQRGLDSLPNFRIFRHDRHRAVRGNANECGNDEGGRRALRRHLSKHFGQRLGVKGQQHTASGQCGDAQE